MTSKQTNICRVLVLCLMCGAFAGLAASMAGQKCGQQDKYKSACKAPSATYLACSTGAYGSDCVITVSAKAGVDQTAVCVDTENHPNIHWVEQSDPNATIELKFDFDPKGGTKPGDYSAPGSVMIPFPKSAHDCFHYKVKYCPADGSTCAQGDPKVIVNGSSNQGQHRHHHTQ